MKYFVIEYENGKCTHGEFYNYDDAINYAEDNNKEGWSYTIEEYESEDDYWDNI